MLQIFTLGLALGLYAAAMPGPINLEVIRRSISRGPRIGLSFGLGASLADVTFVLLSSLGALALINSMPLWGKAIMWLTGAAILFWLGIKGLRAKVPEQVIITENGTTTTQPFLVIKKVTPVDMVHSFLIGLALTLSSPPTIMFWIFNSLMVASTTHLTGGEDQKGNVPYLLAAGVGVACTSWVMGAVYVTSRFHRNLKPKTYVWVERIAGGALCCFASYAVFEAMKILLAKGISS